MPRLELSSRPNTLLKKTWITNSEGCGAEKSNCIPFRVANLSTEFHVVYKNTIAATFESTSVDENKLVRNVGAALGSTEGVIPDHLTEIYDEGSGFQRKHIRSFEFQDVFSRPSSDIGNTDLVKHRINTSDSQPIKQKSYTIPLAKREVVEKKLKDMSERDIMEPSISL